MSTQVRTKFEVSALASYLTELKQMKSGAAGWYAPCIEIQWNRAKPSDSITWINVICTDKNGIKGPLNLEIKNQTTYSNIVPATDAGIAALLKRSKSNKQNKVSKRESQASLTYAKYESVQAELINPETAYVYPTEGANPLVVLIELLDEIFLMETRPRLKEGAAFVTFLLNEKEKTPSLTAIEALAAWKILKSISGIRKGDYIIAASDVTKVDEVFPLGSSALLKDCLIATSTNIAVRVQNKIKDKSSDKKGWYLPNPLVRVNLKSDKEKNLTLPIHDKTKTYKNMVGGALKFGYELMTVPTTVTDVSGKEYTRYDPITNANVHEAIPSRSGITGQIDANSICFSSLGISWPLKHSLIIVKQGESTGVTDSEFVDEDDFIGYNMDEGNKQTALESTSPVTSSQQSSQQTQQSQSSDGKSETTTKQTESHEEKSKRLLLDGAI
jgi:hypothetical protein